MSIMMYMLRHMKQTSSNKLPVNELLTRQASSKEKPPSARLEEFRKMLREKTPIQKLEQQVENDNVEPDHLKPWPNNTNPHTGEIGGPRGPEPTRYGDWERKGKVSDF